MDSQIGRQLLRFCRRLDGIPLAIVEQLAARPDDRFHVLTQALAPRPHASRRFAPAAHLRLRQRDFGTARRLLDEARALPRFFEAVAAPSL